MVIIDCAITHLVIKLGNMLMTRINDRLGTLQSRLMAQRRIAVFM